MLARLVVEMVYQAVVFNWSVGVLGLLDRDDAQEVGEVVNHVCDSSII